MVRYPYTLEVWHEEDAKQDPITGNWTQGSHEWRHLSKCNVYQNGNARLIRLPNGEDYLYSFKVILPARTPVVEIGTKVRIYLNGINMFNGEPYNDDEPKEGDQSAYPVKGFDLFRQKYEDKVLWL